MNRYLTYLAICAGIVCGAWAGFLAGRAGEKIRHAEASLLVVPLEERVAALEGSSYRCIQIRTDRTDVTVYPVERIPVVKGLVAKKEKPKGKTP